MIGGLKKTSLYLLAGASTLGIVGAVTLPAKAASMEELQAQMQAMQAQMKELQRQVEQAKAAAASSKAAASSGGGIPDLKVKWKGAPEISSVDGKFKMKIRGRLNVDYGAIDQDKAITGEDDINAIELRRGRIGIEGVVYYNWKYKFEVDWAGDESAVKDAYISYANWLPIKKSEIAIGNQFPGNSLEEMTSSRFITFLERAAFIEAFVIDRRLGAGLWLGDKHWSFQTGYYGSTVEDQGSFFDDETVGSVRATVAPINTDSTVLHLGASYRHRNAGTLRDTGTADLIRYRARGADNHLADRFVATPNFAESDDMFVLEGAFVYNRFSLQGEYAQLEAEGAAGVAPGVSTTYDGWYISGSLFLTDDMRNYKAESGGFGRQKVRDPFSFETGGWGAWEIAGRYDVINLADGAAAINASTAPGAVMCVDCGDQETWLIGLNWWINDYTAIKFNYNSSDISGGANDGATIHGAGVRAQVDW